MTRKQKRGTSAVLWFFCVGWLGFIFSNSLKSKASSAAQSAPLENLIKPPLEAVGIDNTKLAAELIIRKAAHVTEFFVLSFLCVWALYLLGKSVKESVVLSSLFGITAAITDEVLQIFSNRGAAFTDVLIDLVGVFLASALFWLITKKLKK